MNKYIDVKLPNLQLLSGILDAPITFVDLETTGMVHERNFAIIEIGLVHITPTKIEEKSSLVFPGVRIPSHISEITHIYDDMVKDKPSFDYFAKYMSTVAESHIFCGFNSKTFDSKALEKMLAKNNYHQKFNNQIDFRHVFLRCRKNYQGIHSQAGSLVQACAYHNIFVDGQAHRAGYDIAITAMLAEKMLEKYGFGIVHKEVEKFQDSYIKKQYYQHIVINRVSPIF